MKLLSDVDAGPARFDHLDNALKVAIGALESFDDLRVCFVDTRLFSHGLMSYAPGGDIAKHPAGWVAKLFRICAMMPSAKMGSDQTRALWNALAQVGFSDLRASSSLPMFILSIVRACEWCSYCFLLADINFKRQTRRGASRSPLADIAVPREVRSGRLAALLLGLRSF